MSEQLIQEVYEVLGQNRPSNRRRLSEIFQNGVGAETVKQGLERFLKTWVEADWLDEGSLWNTGKMFNQFGESELIQNIFSQVADEITVTEKGRDVMCHFMSGVSLPKIK